MNYVKASETPKRRLSSIRLFDEADFEGMRQAGALAAQALNLVSNAAKSGITTSELDDLALSFALDNNAALAPLFYRGFPRSICTSLNHVICHGIPGARRLREGDIINIDITLIVDGWHGDTSQMVAIGTISQAAQRLLDVTKQALWKGIHAVKPGATTGDIGHAIQSYVEKERCSVVRDFTGHGLGQLFHDNPSIFHFGRPGTGVTLKPGMFFTIEPMVNLGRHTSRMMPDGWTAVTKDRSLSAQYEHSLAVTQTGFEIFTLPPGDQGSP